MIVGKEQYTEILRSDIHEKPIIFRDIHNMEEVEKMRIEQLRLLNFHGFEEKEITFTRDFTVFIGENSSGKTAILEGVSVALCTYVSIFDSSLSKYITKDEVRLKSILHSQITTLEPQYPSIVQAKCIIHNIETSFENRYDNHKTFSEFDSLGLGIFTGDVPSKSVNDNFIMHVEALAKRIREGSDDLLPIFVKYGTDRLWSTESNPYNEPISPGSRFEGYNHILNPNANIDSFVRWFVQMSLAEIKRKKELDVLTSIRSAITKSMEKLGVQNIEYDPLTNDIHITMQNGKIIPFHLLSDGYRNTIGMVADIAYRMTLLNPFLTDHLQTPGVILVDELDLHLHPKWQRHIVDDLKRTFPNVQFIATTHSPFIVQSLEEGELRMLDNIHPDVKDFSEDEEIVIQTIIDEVASDLYVNKSVEDVSETVMGLTQVQRSEKLNQLYETTKEYYKLVEQEALATTSQEKETLSKQIADTKGKLDELSSLFSDNVAFYAMLEMERLSIIGRAKRETD